MAAFGREARAGPPGGVGRDGGGRRAGGGAAGAWSTTSVSPTPSRRPDSPAGPPRWLLVMLAAGLSLLVAVVALLVLQAAGVQAISSLGFVAVVVVAAVVGGWVTRRLAPRLPDVRRPPRA